MSYRNSLPLYIVVKRHIIDWKVSKYRLDMKMYLEMTHQKLLIGDPQLDFEREAFSPVPKLGRKLLEDVWENPKTPKFSINKSRAGSIQNNKTFDFKQKLNVSKMIVKVSETPSFSNS